MSGAPKKLPDWKLRLILYPVLLVMLAGVVFMYWRTSQELPLPAIILYTGETHGLLYTCNCPIETDGGVSRRASMISQVRAQVPGALLLDSGRFLAGGDADEYTQSPELNRSRSEYMIKAMGAMQYTAAAVGKEELASGGDFLVSESTAQSLPLVSCNIRLKGILPYLIKETSGMKVGIIGITDAQDSGVPWVEPAKALPEAIIQARAAGAGPIIVLSTLSEAGNRKLLEKVPQAQIMIGGFASFKGGYEKVGSSYLVKAAWQGRKLGVLKFSYRNGKIEDFSADLVRLSDKVPDDPKMSGLVPACFMNANCKLNGVLGECDNPGTLQASCRFPEHPPVKVTAITYQGCSTCQPASYFATGMKRYLPGIEMKEIFYPGEEASALVAEFGITTLPAYIFGPEIAADKSFPVLSEKLEERNGHYVVKPELSGVDVFLERPETPGTVDVFAGIAAPSTEKFLAALEGFEVRYHFLAAENKGTFEAAAGLPEVEESLRGVCVQKKYPQLFREYLRCRAKSPGSSWWDDCAQGMDVAAIKTCARSEEGASLLRENIALNRELQVMIGPVILMGNRFIVAFKDAPSPEELRALLKKEETGK